MKDGQTIGQWLKWDFEKNGPLAIKDKNCRFIYRELSDGWWAKTQYDLNGNEIYHDNSTGFLVKREYDSQGNEIYHDDSTGFWVKREYYSDSQGNQIYYESSNGTIIDNRIPEVIEHNGRKYKLMP